MKGPKIEKVVVKRLDAHKIADTAGDAQPAVEQKDT